MNMQTVVCHICPRMAKLRPNNARHHLALFVLTSVAQAAAVQHLQRQLAQAEEVVQQGRGLSAELTAMSTQLEQERAAWQASDEVRDQQVGARGCG